MTDTIQADGTRNQPAERARYRACAHRGDSSSYRENTLPAIRSAIAKGAEFVEVDVRVSADGAVVLLHDPTLERLWTMSVPVAEVEYSRLQALGDRDHRPPLLAEALELFENSSSTLLIDMDTAEPAEAAYRVAAASGISIAWCGDIDGMRTIRAMDPLARIWMPWNEARSPVAADIADLSPDYLNSDFRWMTQEMAQDIHALGCKVAVWTVNHESTMQWCLSIGADSITTDRLGVLQRAIGHVPDSGTAHQAPAFADIDAALAVARELGEWAIGFVATTDPGRISTKQNAADLVTDVDVAVEQHVRQVITQRFPDHRIVGEELGGSPAAGVPCWYLDPIDGTTNFANHVPWNAFSLALAVDDTPFVGVVADPWRGDLFEAVRGRGAKLNGSPLKMPAAEAVTDPLSGRVVSTELASYLVWPGMLEMLESLSARYCTMRMMGSGTMTLVGVAAGRGAGAVIGSFGPADHLAALLIVDEAGGIVLDSAGRRRTFPDSGGIMAAAPAAATELHDLWRAACVLAENKYSVETTG